MKIDLKAIADRLDNAGPAYYGASSNYNRPLNRAIGEAAEALRYAADLLDKLRAAGFITPEGEVRKVNGTLVYDADGNIVAHGGKVWVMGYTPEAHECFTVVLTDDWVGRAGEDPYVSWGGPGHGAEPISHCHSTREAAEAARKERQ